jgi:hypothetical protein
MQVAFDLDGKHIRPRMAGVLVRAHGLVHGEIEAHVQRGLHIAAIEQRPSRNTERDGHGMAKEGVCGVGFGLVGEGMLGGVREESERSVLEVFLVGPCRVVKRLSDHSPDHLLYKYIAAGSAKVARIPAQT